MNCAQRRLHALFCGCACTQPFTFVQAADAQVVADVLEAEREVVRQPVMVACTRCSAAGCHATEHDWSGLRGCRQYRFRSYIPLG